MKINSYLDIVYLWCLLTSIHYVEEVIFELISQENNITSLLGENILLLCQIHFPLHEKQHEIALI